MKKYRETGRLKIKRVTGTVRGTGGLIFNSAFFNTWAKTGSSLPRGHYAR